MSDQERAKLSFGEKLVGIQFNPSNDDKVSRLKSLFAEAANIIDEEFMSSDESVLRELIYRHAVGEILNAQMNCVKLVTLKY